MPLYEYRCPQCGRERDTLQKHTDPPPECEGCAVTMTKKISATSFKLNGPGWARDGYGLH